MENSNNQHQAQTAWDFFRSFDPNGSRRPGVGVDHNGPEFPSGFPFDHSQWGGPWGGSGPWESWSGPWARPWGRSGWHGRHGHGHGHGHGYGHGHGSGPSRHEDRRESDNEENDDQDMESSPETLRHTPDESAASEHGGDFPPPPPPPGAPNQPRHPHHRGPPHGFGPRSRRGGRCERSERSGRGGRGGRHPPPPPYEGPFDFRPLIHAFSTHPFAQAFRDYVGQNRAGPSGEQNEQQDGSFVPPVDIFNTEKAFVLHVSLPGANKEDIGVNWDGEKVNIAGVIYRPGNEEFLQTLTSSERRIGMFERSIKLPPAGSDEKDDVDGLSITAKMENGILIVTVPKTEKEWTQIHKIDVE